MKEITVEQMFPMSVIESGEQAVSARMLFEWMGVDVDHFNRDFKTAVDNAGLDEGIDYAILPKDGGNSINQQLTGGRPKTDYVLTADSAKEIVMQSHKEKGKMVRKYFISCEKKLREMANKPVVWTPDMLIEMGHRMKEQQAEIDKQDNSIKHGYKSVIGKHRKRTDSVKEILGVQHDKDIIPALTKVSYTEMVRLTHGEIDFDIAVIKDHIVENKIECLCAPKQKWVDVKIPRAVWIELYDMDPIDLLEFYS